MSLAGCCKCIKWIDVAFTRWESVIQFDGKHKGCDFHQTM